MNEAVSKLIPPGEYLCRCTKSECRVSARGVPYVVCFCEVLDIPYDGRKIFLSYSRSSQPPKYLHEKIETNQAFDAMVKITTYTDRVNNTVRNTGRFM